MVLIIITIVLLIAGWVLTLIDDKDSTFPYALIGGLIGVVIPVTLIICIFNENPKAIDVYRNKTTLEITYKDGIAIDSVVVFKDKEK